MTETATAIHDPADAARLRNDLTNALITSERHLLTSEWLRPGHQLRQVLAL